MKSRRDYSLSNWTDIGEGIELDKPDKIVKLGFPESYRKGHAWIFGTTRCGKTRLMEWIIEQDIRRGYSVICIDPKGDIPLFSKIVQVATDTGRLDDLLLFNPIFPNNSATFDPLSSYYMVEELVAHITAGVAIGKDPYFFGVAYQVSLLVVQGLIMLAESKNEKPNFNLNDVKNNISHEDIKSLRDKLLYLTDPEAKQLVADLNKVINNPIEFYSKIANSLLVALTELTSGNVGKIIGRAKENRFISRLENGKGVILVVQLGSLLTKKAAYTAGKVIISMLQSYIGRVLAVGNKMDPPISLHIDEAQNVLYQGIDDLFAKAGGANVYIHGYSQSVNQLYAEIGKERGNSILDNCNTKIFMRVPDAETANYVSKHLGNKKTYSPILSVGGNLSIRETEDIRIDPSDVLNLDPRQMFFTTYSGTYRGITSDVADPSITVVFPKVSRKLRG